MGFGVGVDVGVLVGSGDGVEVGVGVSVGTGVDVFVGSGDGVGVEVFVGVGVSVIVGSSVGATVVVSLLDVSTTDVDVSVTAVFFPLQPLHATAISMNIAGIKIYRTMHATKRRLFSLGDIDINVHPLS